MDGSQRREFIIQNLKGAKKAISASNFAKQLQVSRQIIVGDVALLRASGHKIVATARGYLLTQEEKKGIVRQIVCQHTPQQTKEELTTIVTLGGEILDVTVEHSVYGELTGGLYIKSQEEINIFLQALKSSKEKLLSELTQGIHLHKIRCQDLETFEEIKIALKKQGILYHT